MITLKCERCGKRFEAKRRRKISHCSGCAGELRKRGAGPVQSMRKESVWSPWYRLEAEEAGRTVPDRPGVYQVRVDFTFGRLKGNSSVVSIGSAVPNLRRRLLDQRIGNPDRFLSRAEKWLRQAGHTLQFRYATTVDGPTARNLEAQMLEDYEREHWELPPSNAMLPRRKSGPDVAKTA